MKRIAIDFDGVIHQHLSSFGDGEIKDPMVDGAREALYQFTKKGFGFLYFRLGYHQLGQTQKIKSSR